MIDHPDVSVESDQEIDTSLALVIVAKNEEAVLHGLIADLRMLQGAGFRFVLVDDHSMDGTAAIMKVAADSDDRFEYHSVPDEVQGKKAALQYILSQRSEELVALTDADCRIQDRLYLIKLRYELERNGADMCIGSGLVIDGDSMLSRLYAQIVLSQHVLFHTAAQMHKPFMAVGRSMAFRRSAFEAVDGFEGHLDRPAGTDDLLLQSFVRSGKRIVSSPHLTTYTDPPSGIAAWIAQRHRHLSVSDLYPFWALLLVWLQALIAFFVPLGLIILFFLVEEMHFRLLALLLFLGVQLLSFLNTSQFLDAVGVGARVRHLHIPDVVVSSGNALISTLAVLRKSVKWTRRT